MTQATSKPAAYPSLVVYRDVMVPMRDGTRLATDIYLPSLDGAEPARGPFPALVTRTPYGKGRAGTQVGNLNAIAEFTTRGYAVAYQDKRGRFGSEGIHRLLMDDGWGPNQDGHETIEWVARQPWCTGQVGMMGVSYPGYMTIAAAVTRPPHLVAALCAQPSSDLFSDRTFQGGALSAATATWNAGPHIGPDLVARMPEEIREIATQELEEFRSGGRAVFETLPLTDMAFQRLIPQLWANVLAAWDDPTNFAESTVGPDQLRHLAVPVLHVGGWYDPFIVNNLRQYRGASTLPHDARVRAGQRLVVGPWMHGGFSRPEAGETSFPDAAIDLDQLALAWHDAWLEGDGAASVLAHPVTLYVMGENRWRAEDAWPPPSAQPTEYYLHSGGGANTPGGDGTLSTEAPADEPPDHYSYDPADPVSYAGVTAGRNDAASGIARDDVLVYTTPPLDEPVEVTGEIRAILYAESSVTDTDWTVELHDVDEAGRSYLLAEGILRARYRHSRTQPAPLTTGAIERYEIEVRATSNVFLRGHRIRVVVASSKFPRYDRNPNAYVGLASATEADWVIAEQTVHHSARHPSCVVLPIVPIAEDRRWIENPMPAGRPRELPAAVELPTSHLSRT